MKEIAIIRGGLAAALSIAAAACSTGLDNKTDLGIRPFTQQDGQNVSADAVFYQDAVNAIDRRDYATALDYLQAARAKDPKNVRVLNAFGVVYDKLGRFDLSARYYAEASALDPGSTTIARNIAYSRMLQGLMGPQVATSELPAPQPVRTVALSAMPAEAGAPPLAAPTIPVAVQPASAITIAAPAHVAPGLDTSVPSAPAFTPSILTFAAVNVTLPDEPEAQIASLPKADPPAKPSPDAAKVASVLGDAVVRATAASVLIPLRAPQPAPSVFPGANKALLIGRPLRIVDASGRQGAADPVHRSLAALGWSVSKLRPTSVTALKYTTVIYPLVNERVAQSLARTLPFPARLSPDACGCHGVQLVIGTDFLNWKATGRRVPNIWRTNLNFAALSANKGVW